MIIQVDRDNIDTYVESIYILIQGFKDKGNIKFANFNKEVFTNSIKVFSGSSLASIFISIEGDVLEGVICVAIYPCIFSGDLVADELFWYANKNGIQLLKHVEKYCKSRKIERIYMGSLAMINKERMDALYKRMNYQLVDLKYMKILNGGD